MAPSTATAQNPAPVDLEALKARQHGAWSSGDYAVVGTTLQIVGEELCEALDVRSGQKVLDVAAGNGNVTLAAARRWCNVVSTDYVPSLLEHSRVRAAAEGLSVEYGHADAEALGFAEATFDVVVSTFGVMFTPNQDKMAGLFNFFVLQSQDAAGVRNRLRTVWRKTQADLRNKSNLSQSFSATVGSS
jgi:protein-L-isoaspartate O-methyltransferase